MQDAQAWHGGLLLCDHHQHRMLCSVAPTSAMHANSMVVACIANAVVVVGADARFNLCGVSLMISLGNHPAEPVGCHNNS